MNKPNAFQQNYWVFDILVGIAFGCFLGFVCETISDSTNEYGNDRTLLLITTGSVSYLLASIFSLLLARKFNSIPSWVLISILGGIIFAFSCKVHGFINDQYYFNRVSINEYLSNRLDGYIFGLLGGSIVFSSPLFLLLFAVTTVVYLFICSIRAMVHPTFKLLD